VIAVVPDTAVVVKVFLEEEDSPHAHALFRGAAGGTLRLAAPDFMAVEFGNVLWKHTRRSLLTSAEARRAIGRFPFDHIAWLPARVHLPRAFEFASRYDIAVYDAAFLAAADMLDGEFVTADRVLHHKVGTDLPWVRLLREFPLSPSAAD